MSMSNFSEVWFSLEDLAQEQTSNYHSSQHKLDALKCQIRSIQDGIYPTTVGV